MFLPYFSVKYPVTVALTETSMVEPVNPAGFKHFTFSFQFHVVAVWSLS
jgi:hypothetical protein